MRLQKGDRTLNSTTRYVFFKETRRFNFGIEFPVFVCAGKPFSKVDNSKLSKNRINNIEVSKTSTAPGPRAPPGRQKTLPNLPKGRQLLHDIAAVL